MRHPTPAPPAEQGVHDGLAYTLWLPESDPEGGVVILHGAGSQKESHHDYARAARDVGLAAVAYDQRGHGASEGPLDGRAIDDVATMAGLLPPGPVALRGSSMGGWLALVAAEHTGAAAVAAICPAGTEHLLRGLASGTFAFDAAPTFERLVAEHDVHAAVARFRGALLLLHAEGDERIPASHSRELYDEAGTPARKIIVVPGGHHGSVQHDAELQGESLRFIARAFAAAG